MRQTSLNAYREVSNSLFLTQSYRDIMAVLNDSYGMSDREIAKKLGYLDPNKIRPRRHELTKAGLIQDCGKRPCKISKKRVHFWDLTQRKAKYDQETQI